MIQINKHLMRGDILKGVVIRAGRINDVSEVVDIWKEFMDYHKNISMFDLELKKDASEIWMKDYKRYVRSRNRIALIAEKDGKIIGYLLGFIQNRLAIFKTTHQAFISNLAIISGMRNNGVGTKLVESFEEWAKKKGMKYVITSTVQENIIGLKFYRKRDFQIIEYDLRKIL